MKQAVIVFIFVFIFVFLLRFLYFYIKLKNKNVIVNKIARALINEITYNRDIELKVKTNLNSVLIVKFIFHYDKENTWLYWDNTSINNQQELTFYFKGNITYNDKLLLITEALEKWKYFHNITSFYTLQIV